ncbi:hypothetical protein [Streptomyces lavendulae]|uniref:hypothetical protein n=1 Tax=Streptomyces lavendulae TaxID=1914 RepID=UPI0024A55A67|nr:hypothetical protein [Streptomyces lavendulae]GLW04845.1 hypothetical protein Slala05_84750 [Streptomyces lavendulae subsp. lavendulae]
MPDSAHVPAPHPRPATRRPRPQPPERGCLTAVAYEAFCDTHRAVYIRYAATRLGSASAGAEAAGAALDALAWLWTSVLTSAAPARISWQLLTDLVNARAHHGRTPEEGLSGPYADAVILRTSLGLSGQEAADAMGVPLCEFDVLHRAALRTMGVRKAMTDACSHLRGPAG